MRRLEWWLLRLALGGQHLVTAIVVAAVTFVSGHVLGYYFAAFYLLSCAFRPAAAYLGYVRVRIAKLIKETTHPRDDVVELRTRLAKLSADVKALRDTTGSAQERAFRELDGVRDDLRGHSQARLREDLRGWPANRSRATGRRCASGPSWSSGGWRASCGISTPPWTG